MDCLKHFVRFIRRIFHVEIEAQLDKLDTLETLEKSEKQATKPNHEKLFDEICNKLSELSNSSHSTAEEPQVNEHKFERIQTQIKKFQDSLSDTNCRLTEKIKSLENVTYAHSDLNEQLKQLTEQLNYERTVNTKLSADLAKSLELCLQLQLEIQNIKNKAITVQNEERKYSQSLLEKIKSLMFELESSKNEISQLKFEIEKLNKNKIQIENENKKVNLDRNELLAANESLIENIKDKDQQIEKLNSDLEELSLSLNEVETSAVKQAENFKNLTLVAEAKIIEIKMALDKKTAEQSDLTSRNENLNHQVSLVRQENNSLRDYINKLTLYQQQMVQALQAQPQINTSLDSAPQGNLKP